MLTVNNLENLPLYLEHDRGYIGLNCTKEELEDVAKVEIIFSPPDFPRIPEVIYLEVDKDYSLNLSPGQQKLYEVLISIQEGSIRAFTNIGKLADAMGLMNPLAAAQRLQHLNDLGAIKGFKL